jgi:carboxymethylenebutenolidase
VARIVLPSGTAAELVVPEAPAPIGVALCPDIMGLRPLFDDLCARLTADYGWAVCAIEPFAGREDMALDERLQSVGVLDHARVLGDLAAAADATGCARVAVLGFCMGGMYALKAAGTGRFDAAVAFYGMIRVPEHWRSDTLAEPLAAPFTCPVLAILGGRDPYTPAPDIDALRAAGGEAVVYDEAEHGFVHDPSRPAHRAGDAADAWARVESFLGRVAGRVSASGG